VLRISAERAPRQADQARRRHTLAISRWQGLTCFIDDGRIELDNKTVERSIRPIKPGRKNAPFAGSDGGAEHRAVIASL
jgi:transposase